MGVTTSKVKDSKVSGEMRLIDPDNAKRILNVDPRSPTVEIVRTPIQVEQTPDQNPRKLMWMGKKSDTVVKDLSKDMLSPERAENIKDSKRETEDAETQDAVKKFV